MRKTFVVALIALMVMFAFVTCDNIPEQVAEKPADGLVTLGINIGGSDGSRSLIDSLAHLNGNYVEVIFNVAGTCTSVSANFPSGGTKIYITIPEGDYGEDDAIVLIGNRSGPSGSYDYQLLATGVISKITDDQDQDSSISVSNPTVHVDDSTVSITFEVTSLEADISPSSGSDFEIDETTTPTFIGKNLGTYDSKTWFQVPTDTDDIKATLTISGFEKTGNNIYRKSSSTPVTFSNVGGNATDLPIELSNGGVFAPAVDAPITDTGEITIIFSTGDPSTIPTPPAVGTFIGTYMVIFNIPVVGFDTTDGSLITWHIRGGTITSPNVDWDFSNDGNQGIPLLVADEAVPQGKEIILEWS